jgi:hypothetical protein
MAVIDALYGRTPRNELDFGVDAKQIRVHVAPTYRRVAATDVSTFCGDIAYSEGPRAWRASAESRKSSCRSGKPLRNVKS